MSVAKEDSADTGLRLSGDLLERPGFPRMKPRLRRQCIAVIQDLIRLCGSSDYGFSLEKADHVIKDLEDILFNAK